MAEIRTTHRGIEMDTSTRVTVLAVTSRSSDFQSLLRIFTHTSWKLTGAPGIAGAIDEMRRSPAAVVLCTTDLPDGTWRDLLRELSDLPSQPLLLVASRAADEQLWADALDCGAYDVLSLPFEARQVYDSVGQAFRHWLELRSMKLQRKTAARAGQEQQHLSLTLSSS